MGPVTGKGAYGQIWQLKFNHQDLQDGRWEPAFSSCLLTSTYAPLCVLWPINKCNLKVFLKDLHVRNCETSLKAIKEGLHKGTMSALGTWRTWFCWDVCAANNNALPTRVRIRVAWFFFYLFVWKNWQTGYKIHMEMQKKSKKEELSGRSHISILKTRTDAQTQLYKSRKRKWDAPPLLPTDLRLVPRLSTRKGVFSPKGAGKTGSIC